MYWVLRVSGPPVGGRFRRLGAACILLLAFPCTNFLALEEDATADRSGGSGGSGGKETVKNTSTFDLWMEKDGKNNEKHKYRVTTQVYEYMMQDDSGM